MSSEGFTKHNVTAQTSYKIICLIYNSKNVFLKYLMNTSEVLVVSMSLATEISNFKSFQIYNVNDNEEEVSRNANYCNLYLLLLFIP